jgi:hypothetical protein
VKTLPFIIGVNMTAIVDSSGKQIETKEIEESQFVDGKRPVVIIYETEDKQNLQIKPMIKDFQNPHALEQLLTSVLDTVKDENLIHKIETVFQKLAQKALQAQRDNQILQAAMKQTEKH